MKYPSSILSTKLNMKQVRSADDGALWLMSLGVCVNLAASPFASQMDRWNYQKWITRLMPWGVAAPGDPRPVPRRPQPFPGLKHMASHGPPKSKNITYFLRKGRIGLFFDLVCLIALLIRRMVPISWTCSCPELRRCESFVCSSIRCGYKARANTNTRRDHNHNPTFRHTRGPD